MSYCYQWIHFYSIISYIYYIRKILDAAVVTKLLELNESTKNPDKTSYPST